MSTLQKYTWEPGNGTRYELFYGRVKNTNLIPWMRRGGSGGRAMAFSEGSFLHYTYVAEKMDVNAADAAGILQFLERMGHDVGYPEGVHAPSKNMLIEVGDATDEDIDQFNDD